MQRREYEAQRPRRAQWRMQEIGLQLIRWRRVPKAWTYPLLAVLLSVAWQVTTVSINFGGNWTALFRTGSFRPSPPELASEHIYIFSDSYGYDGQLYHLIAHDPFFRRGFDTYLDEPRLRYRRILVPLLAFSLAGGQSPWVNEAYFMVCWLFVGLGTYWLCKFADERGRHPAWGLIFLLLPGVMVSTDRLVTDVALAALAAGFALYALQPPSWRLYLVLAAAMLARETGVLLIAAYCLWLLHGRRWTSALVFGTSIVPALLWYAFVHVNTKSVTYPTFLVPFGAMFQALTRVSDYPPGLPLRWLVGAADVLAVMGMFMALALAVSLLWRSIKGPVEIATLLFALLCVLLQIPEIWAHVFAFGRVYTPLLLFLALHAIFSRSWPFVLPLILVVPRTAMEFGTQILGIAHAALRVQ